MNKDSNKEASVLQKRKEIAQSYCKKMGWCFEEISFNQILEIRMLDSWKSAGKKLPEK